MNGAGKHSSRDPAEARLTCPAPAGLMPGAWPVRTAIRDTCRVCTASRCCLHGGWAVH